MPFQPKKNGHHWAFLEALQDYYDNAEIQCQTFVCGRALTSNYSLNNPSIPDEFHNKMSKNKSLNTFSLGSLKKDNNKNEQENSIFLDV